MTAREIKERAAGFIPQFYPSEDDAVEKRLMAIETKLDTLIRRLDLIFGDAVLLDGRFKSLREIV